MNRDYTHLRTQDDLDAQWMAYAICSPLHHSTQTPRCDDPPRCPMCSNAARLAVQHYRPLVERRIVAMMQDALDVHCQIPHPGSDD